MKSSSTPGYPRLQQLRDLVAGVALLLGCQVVGELIAGGMDLPLPGPVIGLALLLGLLQLCDHNASVEYVADILLRHLQLFFVPAGVGVVGYLPQMQKSALPITAALVLSWLAGVVTVTFVALLTQSIRKTR